VPTLEEIQKQIRNQSDLSKFLAKREIKELPSILWEDETVENIVQGMYVNHMGILVATNKRLLFIDKGLVKLKVEDFPYDKISSLQYETGWVSGKISIFTSGNRAEIERIDKKATKSFAEFLRARITSKSANVLAVQRTDKTADDNEDKYTKLEKLAGLKAKGILTQEEFDKEKKKILAS
jgi:hypothetical protein